EAALGHRRAALHEQHDAFLGDGVGDALAQIVGHDSVLSSLNVFRARLLMPLAASAWSAPARGSGRAPPWRRPARRRPCGADRPASCPGRPPPPPPPPSGRRSRWCPPP